MSFSLATHFAAVWPAVFVNDLLRYALAAGLVAALLYGCRRRLAARRLQTRRADGADIRREIAFSLATVLIFSAIGYSIALGVEFGLLRVTTGPLPGALSLAFDFALIVIAHDAWFYWMHRAIHHPRLFRAVHRLHHRSRTPTPWAAYAFAPAEAVLEALFLPLFWLFVETHVVIGFLFTTHMIVRNVVGHAGVELFPSRWLDWPVLRWVTTTTHHDMHHQHVRGNYGLYFRFWDRLMGTELPDYETRFRQAVRRPSRSVSKQPIVRSALVAVFLASTLCMGDAAADEAGQRVDGRWVTEGFGAIVEIESDDAASVLNATIVWVMDMGEQHLVGTGLFSDFEFDGALWRRGRVLDPVSGRRYRAVVALTSPNRLRLKGCVGPFCRTAVWRRYSTLLARLPSP